MCADGNLSPSKQSKDFTQLRCTQAVPARKLASTADRDPGSDRTLVSKRTLAAPRGKGFAAAGHENEYNRESYVRCRFQIRGGVPPT
jgi:hypothetical protein